MSDELSPENKDRVIQKLIQKLDWAKEGLEDVRKYAGNICTREPRVINFIVKLCSNTLKKLENDNG